MSQQTTWVTLEEAIAILNKALTGVFVVTDESFAAIAAREKIPAQKDGEVTKYNAEKVAELVERKDKWWETPAAKSADSPKSETGTQAAPNPPVNQPSAEAEALVVQLKALVEAAKAASAAAGKSASDAATSAGHASDGARSAGGSARDASSSATKASSSADAGGKKYLTEEALKGVVRKDDLKGYAMVEEFETLKKAVNGEGKTPGLATQVQSLRGTIDGDEENDGLIARMVDELKVVLNGDGTMFGVQGILPELRTATDEANKAAEGIDDKVKAAATGVDKKIQDAVAGVPKGSKNYVLWAVAAAAFVVSVLHLSWPSNSGAATGGLTKAEVQSILQQELARQPKPAFKPEAPAKAEPTAKTPVTELNKSTGAPPVASEPVKPTVRMPKKLAPRTTDSK